MKTMSLLPNMIHPASARDESGTVAVEFAIIAPVLLLMVLGALIFAIALGNYLIVSNSADVGASQLILSRGASSPYTNTVNAVKAAASTLTASSMTITMSVNGASCASDSTCQTALSSAASKQASVTVAYPCSLTVMQVNYASSGCTLSATTVGLVQ